MANPELELVSNIVETGNMKEVKRLNLTSAMFKTEEGRQAFDWLWNEYHDPKHIGHVPDRTQFLRRWPEFDFSPSRNPIASLIKEVRHNNISLELSELTEDLLRRMDDGEDPETLVLSHLSAVRRIAIGSSEEDGLLLSKCKDLMRQQYDTKKNAGGVTGVPFPWAPLNTSLGGMHPEDFLVFYGRPKNMKTWIVCAMAAHAYLCGYRVFVFSKEMSRDVMMWRISSILMSLDYRKLKKAELDKDDEDAFFEFLEALQEIEKKTGKETRREPALMVASDKGKKTASTVDAISAAIEKFDADIAFVDGFYLLTDGRTKQRSNDWKQIGHISQDLKGMAQYHEIPIVGSTQANRNGAKEASGDLDDLSFSDSIGMDADLVARTWRGPNPTGRGAAVMLTFSGVRDDVLRPFVVNAVPGTDFSLLQESVDVKSFLKQKKAFDAAEEAEEAASSGSSPAKDDGKKRPANRTNKSGLRA